MRALSAALFVMLPAALAGCSPNPVERVAWPVTVVPAAAQPGQLVAVPPECGTAPATVSKMRGTAWHNPHLGLGCSQARNFAVQVEEPGDLLGGRRTGAPDTEREAAAVDRYREGREKDLIRTSSGFVPTGGTGGQ